MPFYFTPAGLKKLDLEISRLEEQLRTVQSGSGEIAELGGNAWHDNAGYDALVIDLRGINRRRSEIQNIKNQSVVISPSSKPSLVALGTWVTFQHNGEKVTFGIVGYGQSDSDRKLIAYDTPIAKLIKGLKKGQKREGIIGETPVHVEIIEIESLTPTQEGVEM